jgi:hypothetical protein
MLELSETLTFTVPIVRDFHSQAQQLSRYQKNLKKAKQVYLNTLAVLTVNFYLRCMGIETSYDKCSTLNPVMQYLIDIADLDIIDLGKLECLPVLSESDIIYVSEEVHLERIGYVVVKLDESLLEATILGFVKTIPENGQLFLSQLQSLEDFLIYLQQLREMKAIAETEIPGEIGKIEDSGQIISLRGWLDNIIDIGWQTVDSLLNPQGTQPALNFRSIDNIGAIAPKNTLQNTSPNSSLTIQQGKLLNLGEKFGKVALIVGITPVSSEEMNIYVKVYPSNGERYLPEKLELLILDDKGISVMQATARSTKSIQLNFSSEFGELFSIQVSLGQVSFTESFIV